MTETITLEEMVELAGKIEGKDIRVTTDSHVYSGAMWIHTKIIACYNNLQLEIDKDGNRGYDKTNFYDYRISLFMHEKIVTIWNYFFGTGDPKVGTIGKQISEQLEAKYNIYQTEQQKILLAEAKKSMKQ